MHMTRGIAELVNGHFSVPQNPLRNTPGMSGIGLAELLTGRFSVPQNPIKNALVVAGNTVPGNAAGIAYTVSDKATAHTAAALQGLGSCAGGGGCGCGGCSSGAGVSGMAGLGDFTSDYITPVLSTVEAGFTGPNSMYWIGGTLLAAFLLLGRPEGAEYRYEKKKLRAKYRTYGQAAYSRATA